MMFKDYPDDATNKLNDLDVPISLWKGVCSCTQQPIAHFLSYDGLSPGFQGFIVNMTNTKILRTIQALRKLEQKATIGDETHVLKKNGTWELSDLSKEKQSVGCKWIFNAQYKPDGSIDRYKARLVAKGFTQTYGLNYQEIFALVAKLNIVHVLLPLAINCDCPLYQLDVKNAFLNGDLEYEVYMEIPPKFETSSNYNKVCKLQKSLYGLHQSPKAWFDKFMKVVKKHWYQQGQAYHTLFTKQSSKGRIVILIVYVDDFILTGDYLEEMASLKQVFVKQFKVKNLGNLKYFLRMKVARTKKGILVSQWKYVVYSIYPFLVFYIRHQ